jgi:hypothetical protein
MKYETKLLLGATLVVGSAVILTNPSLSFAINPGSFNSETSFGYALYDIAVNQILKGPVGYVGGIAAMVIGAISLISGRILTAVPSILGGAALLKADDLLKGIGLLF